MELIRPELPGNRRRVGLGQVWAVDGQSARWFVLTPQRVIALFAGGADHTPASLVFTYGDRLRLEQTATVYAAAACSDAAELWRLREENDWLRACDCASSDDGNPHHQGYCRSLPLSEKRERAKQTASTIAQMASRAQSASY